MVEPIVSAVLVSVPEAEHVVKVHRERFDRSAWAGVPAHITVLYPFVPPAQIDDAVLKTLADAVVTVPRFRAELKTTQWFGDQVLWLAPEPDAPFRALTTAVMQAFPGYLPYEGQYGDSVPHLTVGDHDSRDELAAVEREIQPQLPIIKEVTSVQVMCGTNSSGSWHAMADLPLG